MSKPKRNPNIYSNLFDKLVSTDKLTKDGKNWLIHALDPFHDQQIPAAGYPDIENAATVVQCVKERITITAPIGAPWYTTGDNWDCHVALLPNFHPGLVGGGATGGNLTFNQEGTTLTVYSPSQIATLPLLVFPSFFALGGLVINSVAAGAPTWDYNTNPAAPVQNVQSQFLTPSEYINGKCRIVGMGFEVSNTTATMFKQGSVTSYRMPCTPELESFEIDADPDAKIPGYMLRMPPALVEQAQLLYGSKTWEAAEGLYTVSRLNSIENRLRTPTNIPTFYSSADPVMDVTVGAPLLSTGIEWISSPNAIYADGSEHRYGYPDLIAPFDISGGYFSGLSGSTSLTIEVRWYIERCPTQDQTDLVVLAMPSPCYDPVALELYSTAACHLPPGVPVGENPFGEWFYKVVSAASKFLPKLGSALNVVVPGAEMIGKIAGQAATILEKKMAGQYGPKGKNRVPPLPPGFTPGQGKGPPIPPRK